MMSRSRGGNARSSRASARHQPAGAVGDGAMAGALDDGTVSKWIAEGNTEFEDVGAGIDSRERDCVRGREVGIAHGEVDNEAGAVRK